MDDFSIILSRVYTDTELGLSHADRRGSKNFSRGADFFLGRPN